MVRGPVHRRFATKTATQRPRSELHDHKIILVHRHPARPLSLPLVAHRFPCALSFVSLASGCSTRELVTNERDEGDVTTIRNLPRRSESSQIYRDVLQTTCGK